MPIKPRIAIDAMGGDEGVRVMLGGAAEARHRHDRFTFLLVGDESQIPGCRGLSAELGRDSPKTPPEGV